MESNLQGIKYIKAQDHMAAKYTILLFIFIYTLATNALAQCPAIPNVPQVKGSLISGPWAPEAGRTAVVGIQQNCLFTHYESPGSPTFSDLTARWFDLSNLKNLKITKFDDGANSAIAAHGYWQEGKYLRGLRSDWTFQNGQLVKVPNTTPGLDPSYYPPTGSGYKWPNRGLLFQPFHMTMYWIYGDTSHAVGLYKGTQFLANFNPVTETGVIGHPVLIGNYLYYIADQSQTGIAVYDISPSLNSPGTKPTLVGVFKGDVDPTIPGKSVGGYWPEVWGWNGKLKVLFPNRGSGLYVVDITDPKNMFLEFKYDEPYQNPWQSNADPSYAQFQDEFGFSDRYKINMLTGVVEKVISPFSHGIVVSQFSLPVGNLLFTGGYYYGADMPNSQALGVWAHQSEPDLKSPKVGYHRPLSNQSNYPTTGPISIIIPETLKSDTIVSGQTLLLRPVNGTTLGAPIAGRVTYSFSDTITFTPYSALATDTTYQVDLTAGIQDAVGNGLTPYNFRFSTGNNSSNSNPGTITELNLSANPAVVNQSVNINFSSSGFGTGVRYSINFGDGTTQLLNTTATTVSHMYSREGHFEIVVTAVDGSNSAVRSTGITILNSLTGPANSINSSNVAIQPSNNATWLTNQDHDSITKIDKPNSRLEVALGSSCSPRGLAIDNQENIWVTCNKSDRVVIVTPSGNISKNIHLPYGSAPQSIVFLPDFSGALVTLYGAGKLAYLDRASAAITAVIEIGPTPYAISLTASGSTAYVSRFISPDSGGEIWQVAIKPLAKTKTIILPIDTSTGDTNFTGRGLINYISALAINYKNNRLWVLGKLDNIRRGKYLNGIALSGENSVRAVAEQIDLSNQIHLPAARIDIDNAALPTSIDFSTYGDYAFISLQGSNFIAAYDVLQQGVIGTGNIPAILRINVDRAPQGTKFNKNTKTLLVNNFLGRSLSKISLDQFLAGTTKNPVVSNITSTSTEPLSAQELEGKKIFYNALDTSGANGGNRMSSEGYLSCAVCHIDGGHDGRTWDFTDRGEGLRNNIDLRGKKGVGAGLIHWSANFDEVQDFENDIRKGFGGLGFLKDSDFAATSNTLGTRKTGLSVELDALAAYVATLDEKTVPRSPFRNLDGSNTTQGVRGLQIFLNSNCVSCHKFPMFTDSSSTPNLHNVGSIAPESGNRMGQTLVGLDTPSLVGLHASAPYGHLGKYQTLESFFTAQAELPHGAVNNLSSLDRMDLIRYLLEIDGQDLTKNSTNTPTPPGNLRLN